MSLDVHIANTEEEAAHSAPVLSFDETLHDAVFSQADVFSSYQQFTRMSDYYADVIYCEKQIEALKSELEEIAMKTKHKPLANFSLVFAGVCDKALSLGSNIYVACD